MIIGRSEEGLLLDIDGEITDIKLPPLLGMAADGSGPAFKVLVRGDEGSGEEIRIDQRIAFVHAGEAELDALVEDGKRVIGIKSHADRSVADRDGRAADGKRVVLIKSAGDESQIAEALALAGMDADEQQRIMVKINAEDGNGTGKQVIVTRRVAQ